MVIPLGGPMGDPFVVEGETPPEVKDKHSVAWWAYVVLLLGVVVGRCCGLDILGALMTGIMAFFVYFMLKEDCKNMSQYCLMLFGFMCTMNCVLELIALVGLLGGRTSTTTTFDGGRPPHGEIGKTTYTVTVEKHPFFDSSMGFVYNMQSAMMIASPVCNLIGALLAHWSYNAYSTSIFEEREADLYQPLNAPGAGNRMGGGYGGGPAHNPQPRFTGGGHVLGGGGGGGQRPNQPRLFEGSGQRLGD